MAWDLRLIIVTRCLPFRDTNYVPAPMYAPLQKIIRNRSRRTSLILTRCAIHFCNLVRTGAGDK